METTTASPVPTNHNDQDAIMSSPPPPSPRKKSTSSQPSSLTHIVDVSDAKKQLFQVKRPRATAGGATASPKRRKAEFDLLDTTNEIHAKRIASRAKAIQKGKNTAGYDAYVQQVPKEERRPRSMETPSTPNPHWDIPAKRWQGIVKAWRRALHKYDPPDMMRPSDATELEDSMLQLSKQDRDVSSLEGTTPVSAATHPSDEVSPMSTGRVLDFGKEDSDDDLL